jgi:hypothetical protein
VVSVAFVVALPCLIANSAALAKTKLLNCQSSQHSRAGISLRTAAIQAGELVITGYAPSGRATVSADDRFTTISDQTGRFAFHLAYYPTNCTVTLKSSNVERKAIVENCAASSAQGELGPTGARGELGPPGPQGRRDPGALKVCKALRAVRVREEPRDCAQRIPPKAGPRHADRRSQRLLRYWQ